MTKALRIGLDLAPDDPYWVLVREAIYQSAEKCAIHLVSADAYSRRELTDQERISWIDELLALELDALISKDLPEELCMQVLNSGLPIIYASESEVRHPRFSAPFVLNRAAQMIGHYLAERLSGQGSVLIVGGPENNAVNRVEGIHEALGKYPRIRQYHLLGPWDYTQAYTIFLETMRTMPEPVDAIFGLSDSLALAGRDAGQRVDIACQAAQGQSLPAHFTYDLTLVTVENVTEVMAQKLVAIANLPTRMIGVDRQEEQKRLSQLETSLEINRRIGSTLDRQQLLHEIADLIRVHFDYDQVFLYLWSETEQALIQEQSAKNPVATVSLPLPQAGILGQVIESNELIFVPDALRSLSYPPDPNYPTTRARVIF